MRHEEFIRKSKTIIKRYLNERINNGVTDGEIEEYVYVKNITSFNNSSMQGIYITPLLDGNCFIIEYDSIYDRFKYIVYHMKRIDELNNDEKLTMPRPNYKILSAEEVKKNLEEEFNNGIQKI